MGSRAYLNASQSTGFYEWITLTPWVAVNTGGYTTVLNGDYIVVQQTGPSVLSASIAYTGGFSGFTYQVRIYRSDGTVVATGAAKTTASGTCTVSWAGTVTSGQQYTIQGYGYYATWQGGSTNTFTVALSTVAYTAAATLPVTATSSAAGVQYTPHDFVADASLSVTAAATTADFQQLLALQTYTLRDLGPPPTGVGDVATQTFIQSLLSMNLTQPQIDSLIASGFSPYATTTYLSNAVAGTAGPNTSPLATPTYVNNGNATKIPLTQVDVPSGVVKLQTNSGVVDPIKFNVPSTQRWPKASFSPSTYNSGSVNATTTETNVYSTTVNPSMTGNYRLFVTGFAQCTIATDGQYPVVRVRQGGSGINGQIVAVGNGIAEGYQTLPPGGSVAKAQFGATSAIATTYTIIPGWVPVTTTGYISNMNGNYLIAPFSGSATLTATCTYSGSTYNSGTNIQIVDSGGAVIVTGATVSTDSGVCTATITTTVTQGGQYTVRGQETVGKGGVQGSWTNGEFTISSPLVSNTGAVQVIPYNFDQQTPIASGAPTTVYVNVISSGSAQATVTNVAPHLDIVTLPS